MTGGTRRLAALTLCALMAWGCGADGKQAASPADTEAGSADGLADGTGGDGGPDDVVLGPDAGGADAPATDPEPAPPSSYDFIVTGMNFYVPEGIKESPEKAPNPCGLDRGTDNTEYKPLVLDGLEVDGFDLDGQTSDGDGPCPHTDYTHSDGTSGIDFGFLHVMDMIRPARPGQTINVVLASAPSQGLVRIGIRLLRVDDIQNDDDVELLVTTTADTPLLGTDGEIIPFSSVSADNDPAFQSRMPGQIIDGILHAGPADVAVGRIDLLVIQDRVVSLKDAVLRATVSHRPDGTMHVDALMGGWWVRDEMVQAIGQAVLTIGANKGELDCVLDAHMDHAMDGTTCDAMSMLFRVQAVSGFITGLDDSAGGG